MQITNAKYTDGYKVRLTFTDGTQRTVDFGEFILSSSYSTFNQYKNLAKFRKFHLENGNIVWGKNWDLIFPLEQLYEGKIRISENNLPLVAEPKAIYRKKK